MSTNATDEGRDPRAERARMAEEAGQRARLVDELLAAWRRHRLARGRVDRQERARFARDLQDQVRLARRRFREAHVVRSEDLRLELRRFRDRLALWAEDLRNASASGRSTPKPSRPSKDVERAAVVDDSPKVQELVDTDLTVIAGIGPGIEARLKKAGVGSLEKLAGSTSESLQEALGQLAKLANVEQWIAEARQLRELEETVDTPSDEEAS